jgi:hypothetical protein
VAKELFYTPVAVAKITHKIYHPVRVCITETYKYLGFVAKHAWPPSGLWLI